ncbi:MAG: TlpA family protein disulfide reductase [bacterium]|jgi:peroxiredoxin|nr:TlpA family protein disulfide reductase [bacterium]
MIRRYSFLLIILVLFSSVNCNSQQIQPDKRGYIVKVGDTIEDFVVTLLDGTTKKLSEFKAPVLVLNFFASWCVVCRKEIPHIEQEVWQPLKEKGLVVLGVDYKEQADTVRQFVQEMNISYPVAFDRDGKIFDRFARGGVTRNIVLDRNLNILFLTRLFDPNEFEEMKSIIHKHLAVEPGALSITKHGETKMEKIYLTDFAETGKKIEVDYQGNHKIHLEGRIKEQRKKKLEIAISLFKEDIASSKYDKKTKTLNLKYKHYDGIRIAVLPMTPFKVPADIEKIVIQDVE